MTVTVIIPTYNRALMLGRAINSVLNQTYIDFELIIVDDASTDDTQNTVERINDSRMRYIKNPLNRGVAYSKNRGIEKANGEFIAFLDDDDEWLPQKLEKQMELFRSLPDEYGIVYCGLNYCNRKGNIMAEKHATHRGYVLRSALKGTIAGGLVPVIRKKVFDNIGMHDEQLHNAEDWDINIRIARKYKFDYIDIPMVNYYIYGEQLSMKPYRKLKSTLRIYQKYKKLFCENKLDAEILKKIARLYIVLQQPRKAYYCLKKAWNGNKANFNILIQLSLIIVFPDIYRTIKYRWSFTHFGNITLY